MRFCPPSLSLPLAGTINTLEPAAQYGPDGHVNRIGLQYGPELTIKLTILGLFVMHPVIAEELLQIT